MSEITWVNEWVRFGKDCLRRCYVRRRIKGNLNQSLKGMIELLHAQRNSTSVNQLMITSYPTLNSLDVIYGSVVRFHIFAINLRRICRSLTPMKLSLRSTTVQTYLMLPGKLATTLFGLIANNDAYRSLRSQTNN